MTVCLTDRLPSHFAGERAASYSCVVLQDKRRDVDLLGSDAGEELLQVVQVADLLLDARHAEGGEEPRGHLERVQEKEKQETR